MDYQAQPEVYDLLILGSGAGSKLLAWTFAGRGQRVAVLERKYGGGSCPDGVGSSNLRSRWHYLVPPASRDLNK
jgi:choline dehydrogenase-like flavoprotein